MPSYAVLGLFALLGIVYVGGAIVASRLVGTKGKDSKHKHVPYECGVLPFGSARIQFKVGYYLFALVFMIFDVESLFLFPCMAIYSDVCNGKIPGLEGVQVMIELAVFIGILGLGLLFAWRKGVLKWE